MSKSVAKIFGKRQHAIPSPCSELILPLAKVGVEVEVENYTSGFDDVPDLWDVKDDHSLRNKGAEFVTNGGLIGNDLTSAIRELMAHCAKYKYSEGLPRAGIHIHLDVTDLNANHSKELLYFVGTYMLTEHIFFQFAGDWRRNTGYCDPLNFSKGDYRSIGTILRDWDKLSDNELKQFWAGAPQNGVYLSKYQAINLLPMLTFGTIEFRHLPTTFEADRLLTWINMILAIKRFAQEYEGSEPLEVLISRLTPQGFYRLVFGSLFDKLDYKFDYTEAWKAIDNYQAMITSYKAEYFYDGNVNELIAEKLKNRKPPKTKKAAVNYEVPAPDWRNMDAMWLEQATALATEGTLNDGIIMQTWTEARLVPTGFEVYLNDMGIPAIRRLAQHQQVPMPVRVQMRIPPAHMRAPPLAEAVVDQWVELDNEDEGDF